MSKRAWFVSLFFSMVLTLGISVELSAAPGGGASFPYCEMDDECVYNPCNAYEVCYEYVISGRFVEQETGAGGGTGGIHAVVAGFGDDGNGNDYTVSGHVGASMNTGGDGEDVSNSVARAYFHSDTGPDFVCNARYMENYHPSDPKEVDIEDCECRDPSY